MYICSVCNANGAKDVIINFDYCVNRIRLLECLNIIQHWILNDVSIQMKCDEIFPFQICQLNYMPTWILHVIWKWNNFSVISKATNPNGIKEIRPYLFINFQMDFSLKNIFDVNGVRMDMYRLQTILVIDIINE